MLEHASHMLGSTARRVDKEEKNLWPDGKM